MALQDICEDVVQDTEGALGCLVVDLHTGLALACAHPPGDQLDEAEINTALRSSVDLFRGKLIDRFMRSLPSNRASASGFVHEVQITTASSYQFMAAIPGWDHGAVILFAEKDLTLGLGWMAVHQAQERFAEFRPGTVGTGAEPVPKAIPNQSAHGERDFISQAPRPAAPIPPMPSMPVQAPLPPQSETPAASLAASNQTPGTPMPERPAKPAVDPTPVPPPSEVPAAEPIPNPLVARQRQAKPPDTVESSLKPDAQPEAKDRSSSGSRKKRFRSRSSRNR